MPQIRCLITFKVNSSIISIDIINITDNIIRKVINVYHEKCRTNNGPLRNSSINWIFLWRLPIQNYLKPPVTEKRRNKAKYLTWNSIRPKFVKKTSMPNSVERLGYIKCYSLSSPRPVPSDTTVRRSAVDREDLKPCWKSEKRSHFCGWSTILLFTSFSKTFLTTERRLTGW